MASNHSLGIARKKEMENQFFIITNDSKNCDAGGSSIITIKSFIN
jgi:hypothetical protein